MHGQDFKKIMNTKLCLLLIISSLNLMSSENFGIVVHGGAGVLSGLSKEQQKIIEEKVSETVISAYKMLEQGGSSIDIVEYAVSEFEDSPLFNAGRGSVYNANEVQEMDASIMHGKNRSAGAVASVKKIKNPIKLARKISEYTEHVLLVGDGAESFAQSIGETIVDPSYFYSEKNLLRLRKQKKLTSHDNIIQDKIGTVGAVALDKMGNISAGTSTGGMTNKMPGRVGDSPLIGAGTWAQNDVCGVSSTGHGEFFIKYQVAKEVCTRIEYLGQSLNEASSKVISELYDIGASGGLIAIDKSGNVAMPFNTQGMIRGSLTNKSKLNIAIY